MLDRTGKPEWAVYSQHQGGTRRRWRDVPVENGTHPIVYVALFGAGLAYATYARSRTQRWAISLAALLLAIAVNGIHGVILRNTTGVSLLTIGLTWLGALVIFAIMFWSLRQQHQCIERELVGEVPYNLRFTLLRPGARAWAETSGLEETRAWRGWRQTRDTFQLCVELAFRKAQSTAHPDQPELADEVNSIRSQLNGLNGVGLSQKRARVKGLSSTHYLNRLLSGG